MKTVTRGLVRVLISILYIACGIMAPISAFKSLIALDPAGIVTGIVGVLMLIAGFFGLLHVKRRKVRLFGIIIFVVSVVSIALSLPNINYTSIAAAILAWLFIISIA